MEVSRCSRFASAKSQMELGFLKCLKESAHLLAGQVWSDPAQEQQGWGAILLFFAF